VEHQALAICEVPEMLPHGIKQMVRAALHPQGTDDIPAAHGRDSLPVRILPVQFRELPGVQGEVFLAQTAAASAR